MSLQIGVLGPLRVILEGRDVPLVSPIRRAVLGVLVAAGSAVSADRLIDAVWGDLPPDTARRTLQSHLSRLRQTLGGPEVIASVGSGYALIVDPGAIDADHFTDLVARSVGAAPETAVALLDEALELWRGPAYADFDDRDFARPEVARLDELRMDARERRAAALIETGAVGVAVATLEALVVEAPLRERAWVHLSRALGAAGRPAEGLRALDRARDNLANIGLEPSAEVREAEKALLDSGYAPAATPTSAPDRLPHRPTSFRGRDQDVADLADLLRRARIVTLTGPPGVGKSRLAIELGHAVRTDDNLETALTSLGPVSDDAVVAAIGSDLDLGAATVEGVVAGLQGRRMLIVVDNCDHVLDALAPIVESVVAQCPGVRIVATSRERLGVDGEHVWSVTPLGVAAGGSDGPAIALFVDRARAADPALVIDDSARSEIRQIVTALAGLPLAIEMAAAQLGALSLTDIARLLPERLLQGGRTSDTRHRTLVGTMRWTYRLLDESSQELFDLLSCFAGGFTLDAALGVTDGTHAGGPADVVDGLVTLVDRSLVHRDRVTGRYSMPEVIRQIAATWLDERGRTSLVRLAHARYFTAFLESLGQRLRSSDEPAAVELVYRETDNLRSAHRTALANGDIDLLARMGSALHFFTLMHETAEFAVWAAMSVDAYPDASHPLWPAVRASAAAAAIQRGDTGAAIRHAEAGLAVPGGGEQGRAACRGMLVETAFMAGRLDVAIEESGVAIQMAEAAGDDFVIAVVTLSRCLAFAYQGDVDGAEAECAALIARTEQLRVPTLDAWAAYLQGEIVLDRDPERAIAAFDVAVAQARSVGNEFLESVAVVSAASLHARHGDPAAAAALFRSVIIRWRRRGDSMRQWTTLRNLVPLLVRLGLPESAAVLYGASGVAPVASFGDELERLETEAAGLRGVLGDALFEEAIARGRALPPAQVADYALSVLDDVTSSVEASPESG